MSIIRFDNKGWRARFDDGFNEQNVSRIADAFAYIWADAHPGATVIVGYDTRYNGRGYAALVAGVIASYG
ncbi:MAG: phosphoglucomutase, partial [Atopobiaceae bacterium]|nr:phosphoglucomutase [Atopobiaceae bacterium]